MILAIVLLAFAVFGWGVRYKVSLYNPAAHMSAAKLLSQRERPATFETIKLAAHPLIDPGPVVWFAVAMGTVLAGFSLSKILLLIDVRDRVQQSRQISQTFFFFRPPPFLFASR